MPPISRLPHEDLEHVLTHTRSLWEAARGQSFFITGGTGFFGIWLLESFAQANDVLGLGMRATVLTRDPARFAVKAPHLVSRTDLHFIEGDIRSFPFPTGTFSHVIHGATAASAQMNQELPREMLDVIIDGTRRTLDFAAQAGTRKLLFISSGAVYGRPPAEVTHIPEDYPGAPDPLLPASAYGIGKRVAEHMCMVHGKRFDCEAKIARCFAFVGPHLPLDTHFAIGNFIRDALKGRPIRVNNGRPLRSYLYASDLAIWLWTILFQAPSARAYNVGSHAALSITELAQTVSRVLGNSTVVDLTPPSVEGDSISRYIPSVVRAEQDLGLRVRVPLEEAIRRTAGWWQTLNSGRASDRQL